MSRRSKSRKYRHRLARYAPASDSSDRHLNWLLVQWDESRGRPPLIILVGLWLINAPMVALLFGMSVMCFYFAGDAAREGPMGGPVMLCASVALAAVGYYLFLRPLWRAQTYYSSFNRDRRPLPIEQEPPALPQGELPPEEVLQPHTVQCDQVMAACHAALERDYSLRQVSDKELPRHEKLLRMIVNPAFEGQIDLLDACEVSRPPQRLTYCVVSYRHDYSSGRSRIVEQRVGQLVMLTLAWDVGRLWIRPETISDKLVQWWDDDDLDFADHPQFSHRYHCQSDNPTLILLRVPDAVWQAIGQRNAMIIRAHGTQAIVAKEGPLDPQHSAEVVELGFTLMSAFAAEPAH